MLDQLKDLRARLDAAIALLEPLAPLLGALEPPQRVAEPPKATIRAEAASPAAAPPPERQGVCAQCGGPMVLDAKGRKKFCGANCRKRASAGRKAAPANGRGEDLEPLPDVTERPFRDARPDSGLSDPDALNPPLAWKRNGEATTCD